MQDKEKRKKTIFIHLATRYSICCVLNEIHFMDFVQTQPQHYEQKNKVYGK